MAPSRPFQRWGPPYTHPHLGASPAGLQSPRGAFAWGRPRGDTGADRCAGGSQGVVGVSQGLAIFLEDQAVACGDVAPLLSRGCPVCACLWGLVWGGGGGALDCYPVARRPLGSGLPRPSLRRNLPAQANANAPRRPAGSRDTPAPFPWGPRWGSSANGLWTRRTVPDPRHARGAQPAHQVGVPPAHTPSTYPSPSLRGKFSLRSSNLRPQGSG